MAGFWIKWECGLTRKREVAIIARELNISRREAAAMCMEFWEWASEQSTDGMLAGLDPATISELLGIPGFAEAMLAAGWLKASTGAVQVPNWERHNAKPAKERLLAAERKRKERSHLSRSHRDACHGDSVTCHAHQRQRQINQGGAGEG